jgi:hypothetical protein
MKQLFKHVLLILAILGLFFVSKNTKAQEVTNQSEYPSGKTPLRQTSVVSNNAAAASSNTNRAMAGPANDLFANATLLTVGAGLVTGTNYQGSLETNEELDCNASTAVSSVWYYFSAGANTTLYVNIFDNGLGFFYTGAAVWNTTTLPTGTCQALQCQDNEQAALGSYSMELTNLTNQNYYIQVTYPSTGDNNNNFRISVTTAASYTVYNPPPVNTCATAYTGCYINSYAPSAATIEASCPGYQYAKPPYPTNFGYPAGGLQKGYVYSICYSFTNLNTSGQIDIQNLLFTCAGNTLWMDYTLYNSGCSAIACGNISNLTVSGVGCNTQYEICETFEAACNFDNGLTANNGTNKGIIPYASWPSSSPVTCSALPITLKSFNVDYEQPTNTVYIDWVTATETNNKLFTVEKSVDGVQWLTVATQQGAGTSSIQHNYSAVDDNPFAGVSYYRLKQTDLDGTATYFSVVPINVPATYHVSLFPNPTTGNMTLNYTSQSMDPVTVKITDLSGKVIANYMINEVTQGENNFNVNTSSLRAGMYFMQVSNPQKTFYLKIVKE